jgi:DNA/RNA-binding domain of Phe-tRNA-synthetase-like protein
VGGRPGDSEPLRPAPGFIAPEVASEFPGLRLDWATVTARRRPSPPALVAQLRRLSSRERGATVVTMRTKPIPHAYRAFYRQIGLDPDAERIPSERAAVQRLLDGGYRSVELIVDACLLALIETGVPVWALDADRIDEHGLGIRLAADSEPAAPGALVVADGSRALATLFGDPWPDAAVGPGTRRVALYAVAVEGVPAIHCEETLWLALDLLGD